MAPENATSSAAKLGSRCLGVAVAVVEVVGAVEQHQRADRQHQHAMIAASVSKRRSMSIDSSGTHSQVDGV